MNRFTYWRFKKPEVKVQKIKKFFILDFEATCDRDGTLKPPEIIEFPCIKADATTMEVEQEFHRYVRPRLNKILTPFCTDLTGIMQEMVDNEPEFDEVLKDFCEWLKINFDSATENESIFVTCGNWDLMTMLPEQCRLSRVEVPKQMLRWINLKMAFCSATGFWPQSLAAMFRYLEKPMHGKYHSGINDCRNMLLVMKELKNRNFVFEQTNSLDRKR